MVEDVLVGKGNVNKIAAGRVQHALGFAGRTRGVEDKQWILGIHRHGRAGGRLLRDQLMPPQISAPLHRHRVAGAPDQDDFLDRRAVGQRFVGGFFHGDVGLGPAQGRVLGDQNLAGRVLDAVAQRFG